MPESRSNPAMSAQIRSVGTSAAIGAALLLYFGFVYLAEPTGNDLFDWSAWVFFHTLRIGGLALAIAAVWLWMGGRYALLFDAAVALPIGVFLILTGVGMLLGGGGIVQTAINVICGAMFVSSGLYTARLFAAVRPRNGKIATAKEDVRARGSARRMSDTSDPPRPPAGGHGSDTPAAPPPGTNPPTRSPGGSSPEAGSSAAPPPAAGGYLAGLARKDDHADNR